MPDILEPENGGLKLNYPKTFQPSLQFDLRMCSLRQEVDNLELNKENFNKLKQLLLDSIILTEATKKTISTILTSDSVQEPGSESFIP